jgi:peptidoglycan/LPS O-acetylase OafA/YrhL
MTFSVNRKYIPEVDQIRAFAATLVLSYHCLQLIGAQLAFHANFDERIHYLFPSNPIIAFIEEGHSGVTLFIVLSGFILSLGAIKHEVRYTQFLLARILRIYPVLIVCAVVGAYVGQSSLASFLTSVLPVNLPGGINSYFVGMFWAVAIEFQCYLIFPFLIRFSNEKGTIFLVQVIAVAIVLRFLAVAAEGVTARDISYWTVIGRIDEFCIGMIAARLYLNHKPGAIWFIPAAIGVVVMLVVFNKLGGRPSEHRWKIIWPTIEASVWACFIVTYLAAGRMLPQVIGRMTARLGEISYSSYMFHFVIIFTVVRYKVYVQLTGNGYYDALLTTLLVVLPATICVALLSYATVELPFLEMRPKYVER